MSALICKMCGGDLEIREGMTTAKCPYCGTVQTLPKLGSGQRMRLFDRANHFRRANDYDKAMAMYEQILIEDQTDSEAYWSIVLCRYGIEYVEDPASHRRIPTVNRMQYTSVLADEDYKAALRYADVVQARIYEQEAAAIDGIQRGILQVSQREGPYDIFICYKEADEKGNRTRDSVLACELYHQLEQEGLKVFCSRITLEDKLGMAYEPYIFAALHSARIMIVLGTSPENFQAVWVRNEWSRYLSLIRNGEKKVLIPAYRDMDPYDLPKEFSHLQALDLSRLGFAQDLTRGIRKILGDSGDMFMHSGEFTAPNGNVVPLAGFRGTGYQVSDGKVHRTGWESYGWKIGVALGSVLVLAVLFINSMGFYLRWKLDREEISAKSAEQTGGTEDKPEVPGMGQDQNPVADFSGILEQFVSRVYQCPAKEVSDSQLAKLRQLTIRRDWEFWQIGYSFEAPVINSDQSFGLNAADGSGGNLAWESFSTEEKLDLSSLYRFHGLKKLDVDCPVTAEYVKGLHLESIGAYFSSPAEAAEAVGEAERVRELGFNNSIDNLDGIEQFENLETLYVDRSEFHNIDVLIHVGNLKNLTLNCKESLTDYTVLGKLTNLERLSLEAEGIKNLDFIGSLEHLTSLRITGAKLQTLAGIEDCMALKSLSVTSCAELRDMSMAAELKNLKELTLEVPYACPEPDLSRLTGLNKLTLEAFHDCSFIQNMTELMELHLYGCYMPEGMDLSKLTSLKELSCTSYTGSTIDIGAIEGFQMLERLDLHGAQTYDDISGLFRMPKLKELNISDMQCELRFDAVGENSTLEILHMDDMYLYENVWVDYNAGITMVDWDEVILDGNTDFLKKLTKLKELYLSGNGLTELSFAEGLHALEVLDISENYITQLRPLAGLSSLKKVICPGNPLKNEKVLRDSVQIITDSETGGVYD